MENYRIVSERLNLRDIAEGDAKAVYGVWNNKENEEYMVDPVDSIDEIASIAKQMSADENNFLTVVSLKGIDKIIGTICFGKTGDKPEWGFGYNIKKEYWGNGYATEIVKAVIEYGRGEGIKDFISSCAAENLGSARVLEKSGMIFSHNSSFKQPKSGKVYVEKVYKLHFD